MTDRPVALPFVRSPSDRAHDRIKGEYTAEDAIRPGPALIEVDPSLEEGLIEYGEGGSPQSHEEAADAELTRRESFSDVELQEAEARDRIAERNAELSEEDIPTDPVPNVGSIPDHEDANAEPDSLDAVTRGSELAAEVAQAKQDPETDAEPVLEGEGADADNPDETTRSDGDGASGEGDSSPEESTPCPQICEECVDDPGGCPEVCQSCEQEGDE